jgi:hypothetical protein
MVEPEIEEYDTITPYKAPSAPLKFVAAGVYNNMVTNQVKNQVSFVFSLKWSVFIENFSEVHKKHIFDGKNFVRKKFSA